MDRVHYAGDTFLTGSEIAHALIDYAQALSQAGTSGTVRIPTAREDGSLGSSELLVGPSSQIISSGERTDVAEVSDPALVAKLTVESERLRRYGVTAPSASGIRLGEPDDEPWSDDI